ncbi:MAG: YrhK family protein [Humibacillus sp.]|nr:YrhK family protein [Humibacillus sp.]MDN5778888.1 YrhK family protein [Humibacillus sp.]
MDSGAGSAELTEAVPDLPEGWRVVHESRSFGFVTRLTLEAPDGSEYEWTSRRHRKLLGLGATGRLRPASGASRPSRMSWWLAALFGIGSLCFATGSLPLYFDAVSPSIVAWTFFVGSLFFTSAGYLSFHETVIAPQAILAAPRRLRLRGLVHWRPHRIDWWAGLIQLAGTIAFNVSTFAATRSALDAVQQKHLIWTPDVVGSVCFLVASVLAYAEVNRGVLPRSDHSVGWRIAALNLFGSVAFGVAAIAARYLPTTGQTANIALVNLGTFVGAIAFLVGAVLLPVESSRAEAATAPRR